MLSRFEDLVKEVRSMRKDLGWTQKELASKAGVSQSNIAKLEQKTNVPNYKTTRKIYNKLRENMNKKEENAGDLLNPEIVSIKPNDPIEKAGKLMREHDYSQLPVKKKGEYVGILLSKDIVTTSKDTPTKKVMRHTFPIIPPNTPRPAIAELLKTNNAVLVKGVKRIQGIITPADLL